MIKLLWAASSHTDRNSKLSCQVDLFLVRCDSNSTHSGMPWCLLLLSARGFSPHCSLVSFATGGNNMQKASGWLVGARSMTQQFHQKLSTRCTADDRFQFDSYQFSEDACWIEVHQDKPPYVSLCLYSQQIVVCMCRQKEKAGMCAHTLTCNHIYVHTQTNRGADRQQPLVTEALCFFRYAWMKTALQH